MFNAGGEIFARENFGLWVMEGWDRMPMQGEFVEPIGRYFRIMESGWLAGTCNEERVVFLLRISVFSAVSQL